MLCSTFFKDMFWVINNYKHTKICSVSQVGQDGALSRLRQEFEPPTEYQIEPMLISNVNFGNLKVAAWPN